jgi:hypothetical protein
MLIPFGVLSAAGAAVGEVDAYELISSTILGGTAASVTFSNLGDYSSTYKHLELRAVVRTSRTSGVDGMLIRLNADSGSNYSRHDFEGNGTVEPITIIGSFNQPNQTAIFVNRIADENSGTSIFSSNVTTFLDTFSSTKNKTVRTLSGLHTSVFLGINFTSGAWYNTASTTSITLTPQVGLNFVAGSRFSLYGIRG